MSKRRREVIQPVQGQARVFLACEINLPLKAREYSGQNITNIQKAISQNEAEREWYISLI